MRINETVHFSFSPGFCVRLGWGGGGRLYCCAHFWLKRWKRRRAGWMGGKYTTMGRQPNCGRKRYIYEILKKIFGSSVSGAFRDILGGSEAGEVAGKRLLDLYTQQRTEDRARSFEWKLLDKSNKRERNIKLKTLLITFILKSEKEKSRRELRSLLRLGSRHNRPTEDFEVLSHDCG